LSEVDGKLYRAEQWQNCSAVCFAFVRANPVVGSRLSRIFFRTVYVSVAVRVVLHTPRRECCAVIARLALPRIVLLRFKVGRSQWPKIRWTLSVDFFVIWTNLCGNLSN